MSTRSSIVQALASNFKTDSNFSEHRTVLIIDMFHVSYYYCSGVLKK